MGTRIRLITLLCIGWIAYTNNSNLLLQLNQFQSGGDITLVCSSINTTTNISITFWYLDEDRVLTSVFAVTGCTRNPPNGTTNNPAYRYDLFTTNDGSVSCGYNQHNMTLTTTQYTQAGTVWRCEDGRFGVSNNLTLAIPGTTDKSTSPLTDSVTTIPTDSDTHDSIDTAHKSTSPLTESATTITTDSDTHGVPGTTNKTSPQLTDSATTLAKLTTSTITTAPNNDNQDDTAYNAAGAGGCIMILIVILICVGVVRRRNGTVKQDVSLAEVDAPQYDTLDHSGGTDPCYSEIKKEAPRHSSINANDVYYNTVTENADYENPPMIT